MLRPQGSANVYHKDAAVNADVFRKKFKYYKSRKPKPSLSDVITVNDTNQAQEVTETASAANEDHRYSILGLKDLKSWKVYSFDNHPGLLLIPNPFTSLGQRYWIRKCLEEYSRKPNKTNIDIEVVLKDWWASCFKDGTCNKQLQKKLRWCTLGYHHNWDTKVYSDENRSLFPEELAELCSIVANYLGYSCFKAEAAIINYYHSDSTLSPHTDHSEVNLDAPLFSFSFGQPAIFLIGGREKYIEPSAIQLDSGDIVIMSKEARLCYHAVPKILESKATPWNDDLRAFRLIDSETDKINFKYIKSNQNEVISEINNNTDTVEWKNISDYITESRINMNVRQVLHNHQSSLKDVS